MSDYLTEELIEKAALADLNHWRVEWNALAPLTGLDAMPNADEWRRGTRAALEAVLPEVVAKAKAEAIDERAVKLAETSIHVSHVTGQALSRCVDLVEHIAKDKAIRGAKAEALLEAIAQVTDDAAMDAWWEASDDGWAAPPYLPARFLRHWLRAHANRIGAPSESIDAAHIDRQRAWSLSTFGPGARLNAILDHISRELAEIAAEPGDVTEWADVVILALDGAWRAGWEPQQIIDAIRVKQSINESRSWPDWRTADPDKAIEHVAGEGEPRLDACAERFERGEA